MARLVKDSFLDLEKHRQLLEENIEKLRQSLIHWQIWEVEYEGLKEEVLSAGPEASHERLLAVGREFNGKLVTQAEVEDIIGVKIPRRADQVTNVLSRRIDYVSQNVRTLEKQLETAENKLTTATIVSNPDVRNEEGLPMTEIIEELDEDGNVISGRTETQGSARGQLQEVLEKAGIKDLPMIGQAPSFGKTSEELDSQNTAPENEVSLELVRSDAYKKSVKFAEGTKEAEEASESQTAPRAESIRKVIKKNSPGTEEPPVIPVGESQEDAALRKEMLHYGMSEVSAVVAELDLEDGSNVTDEEDCDDYDASSTEDEEDEHGRSTRKVVNDEMLRSITELQKKLGLRTMQNVGPNPPDGVRSDVTLEVQDAKETSEGHKTAKEKKGVRFAEKLDIAEAPHGLEGLESRTKALSKSPWRDVIERSQSTIDPHPEPAPTQKVSRFKRAQATKSPAHQTDKVPSSGKSLAPIERASRPLADTIVEREIKSSASPEPDEIDPALLQQEVATEYHRMRNRLIQKQGGFMKNQDFEDEGIIPLTEEEGGPKKMSRFKAARLARN